MTKVEQLKKRVDFNTKVCKKCTKNCPDRKKPHHPTCLYAKARTPAGKVVLDAMTDWEKQSLNLPTKNMYMCSLACSQDLFSNPDRPLEAQWLESRRMQ
jgi:hypothetical protein